MKHNSFLLAALATAACLSASTAASAANFSTAAGLANAVPARNVHLAHTYPFKHCHYCAGQGYYLCHTVGPAPACPPSGRVYQPRRRPTS